MSSTTTTVVVAAALNISKLPINILLSSSSTSTSSTAAPRPAYQLELCRPVTRWSPLIGSAIAPTTPAPELLLLLYLISFDLISGEKIEQEGEKINIKKRKKSLQCRLVHELMIYGDSHNWVSLSLSLCVLNSPVSEDRFPTLSSTSSSFIFFLYAVFLTIIIQLIEFYLNVCLFTLIVTVRSSFPGWVDFAFQSLIFWINFFFLNSPAVNKWFF